MAAFDPIDLPFSASTADGPTWRRLDLEQAYWYDGDAPCTFARWENCTEGRKVLTRCSRLAIHAPANDSVISVRCPRHQAHWVRVRYGVTA